MYGNEKGEVRKRAKDHEKGRRERENKVGRKEGRKERKKERRSDTITHRVLIARVRG